MRLVNWFEKSLWLLGIALLALLVTCDDKSTLSGSVEETGYQPNPVETARFLATLDKPLYADAGADTIRNEKRDTYLYRAMNVAHQDRYGTPWSVGNQGGVGSCVGWGFSGAAYCSLAVAYEQREMPDPPMLVSPTSVYAGSRVEARGKPECTGGSRSDGSYGGAAAKWLSNWGLVFRDDVLGHDLREYSVSRCKRWGREGNGGCGDDHALDDWAKQHPCGNVALVSTFDEAAAAIQSGYAVAVCSGVGFNSPRKHGLRLPSGSWSHCMFFCAVVYRDGESGAPWDALLCVNSWGPKPTEDPWPADQPDGTWWVERKTVDLMLGRWKDSFAIGVAEGFPYRDLSHTEWMSNAN